jgi:hypothetical protein
MAVKRHVRALSRAELDEVCDWLDDADFSTAEVRWDRDARTVTIPFANYTDDPDFPPPVRIG